MILLVLPMKLSSRLQYHEIMLEEGSLLQALGFCMETDYMCIVSMGGKTYPRNRHTNETYCASFSKGLTRCCSRTPSDMSSPNASRKQVHCILNKGRLSGLPLPCTAGETVEAAEFTRPANTHKKNRAHLSL